MFNPTESESYFELWCNQRNIEFRRIQASRVQGRQRPDYAINLHRKWCVVEVKQIEPNDVDSDWAERVLGTSEYGRLAPGARLTKPIRKASDQLRKFSIRRFPTIVVLFDTTMRFHTNPRRVRAAMFGRPILWFTKRPNGNAQLSQTCSHEDATLTERENTSISAVAVLQRAADRDMIIDLYHNPFARVPIDRSCATHFVRKQS
jgi:hypothetical protein